MILTLEVLCSTGIVYTIGPIIYEYYLHSLEFLWCIDSTNLNMQMNHQGTYQATIQMEK